VKYLFVEYGGPGGFPFGAQDGGLIFVASTIKSAMHYSDYATGARPPSRSWTLAKSGLTCPVMLNQLIENRGVH
jgi:hypothetical protein